MVYVLQVAFAGCCSLLSQAAEGGSRPCRQPGWLPDLCSSFRASFFLSPHHLLVHHGEHLTQKEPRICERSSVHTQGKREALYNPSPRQNTGLEKSRCTAGLAVPHPSPSAQHQVSRVLVLQWLLRWFQGCTLHHDVKTFCAQQVLQGELNSAAAPWHSWLPARPAQPAMDLQPLVALAGTRQSHLPRAGKWGCSGPHPAAVANLLWFPPPWGTPGSGVTSSFL